MLVDVKKKLFLWVCRDENFNCSVTERSMMLNSVVKVLRHSEPVEHDGGTERDLDQGLARVSEVCQEESQVVEWLRHVG